jgi:hypothetical protein
VQQLEELMTDQAAFKTLLQEAVKGSPVSATPAMHIALTLMI